MITQYQQEVEVEDNTLLQKIHSLFHTTINQSVKEEEVEDEYSFSKHTNEIELIYSH